MTLQTRLLLLVAALVLFTVAATAIPLTLNSRSSTLDDARAGAQRLATVVARSAAYSEQAWRDVEETIGRQMVVQAAITAEWIAAAEQAGMSPNEINDRLRGVTKRTALDEIWVTDPRGHAYLHSVPGIDFTFSPDPGEQRQASAFYPLLKGETVVIQRAQRREVDDRHFKYVGVSGVDEPRIVQVGYESTYLAGLRRQVGLVRLVDETAGAPGVESVRVVNERLGTSVYRAGSDPGEPAPISERENEVLREAERTDEPQDFEQGETISVAAPIEAEGSGGVIGGVLVALSTEHVQDQMREDLLLAIGIAALVLSIALLAALIGARRIAGPVNEITAAAQAVHDTNYEAGSLDRVAARRDELGRLAQIFDQMARQVHARIARMQQEIRKLVVEVDETKREKQVAEITDTDYFRDLQRRAKELRARSGSGSDGRRGSGDGS
jgi:HAMP domain-containing protein